MKKRHVISIVFLVLLGLFSCDNNTNKKVKETKVEEEQVIVESKKEVGKYPIVGTNQTTFFNNTSITSEQHNGDSFYGQNANYPGNVPNYIDNNDGTVTDNVSGLMWQQSFDHNADGSIDVSDKLTYKEIIQIVDDGVTFAGYNDWRLPSIKEMYSLILFSGRDIAPESLSEKDLKPFIDQTIFDFAYGDIEGGERIIDMQCATTNLYVSQEIEQLLFGVNFADGRIKGYGLKAPHGPGNKKFNYLLVRGNKSYGKNNFIENGDKTITDQATGLMWSKDDNGEAILWQEALAYAEGKEFAGYDDWRLPDAKELQSLVDYSRSPATTNSAAIDPLFNCTVITNEKKEQDFPWYWTSTTHSTNSKSENGENASYVAFGRSLGNMNNKGWVDIHGAGSQRSDPKIGNPADYSEGEGPQGDAKRIYNYVRLVRNSK